jgi:hypothetical protein
MCALLQNGVQLCRNVVFCFGPIVIFLFVFMHIVGSIFIFNIFIGATPSCACLALRRMVEAAEGIKPEQSWAHAPLSVFNLRFELSPFLFIYMMGSMK